MKHTALDIIILLKYRELFTNLTIDVIIFISVFEPGSEFKSESRSSPLFPSVMLLKSEGISPSPSVSKGYQGLAFWAIIGQIVYRRIQLLM